MEQYRDFTYYSHMQFENSLNIGWEEAKTLDNTTELNSSFFEKLWMYTNRTFNRVRELPMHDLTFNNKTIKVGMAEIRVVARLNGKVIRYAAPDSIMLNILNRKYNPPQEFINAVMEGIKPDSEEYEEFVKRYSSKYFWGESDDYIKYATEITCLIKNKNLRAFAEMLDSRKDSISVIIENGSLLNASILEKATDLSFELLERGFDFNRLNAIELINAVKMGENEIVKYLLSNKIILNLTEPKFNPYFIAILYDNTEAVKLLIESNVDKSIKYSTPFMSNMDAVQFAVKNQKKEIAKLLS